MKENNNINNSKEKKTIFKPIDEKFKTDLEKHLLVDKRCKNCGMLVQRVSVKAEWVICWRCALIQVEKQFPTKISEPKKPKEEGFIVGWKFMKQFVHKDGRVFQKGIEIPELNGTLPPTDVLALKEERKKNKVGKEERKTKRLVKQFAKKQKAKKRKVKKGK
jgi:hypothetical protein